MTDDAPKVIPDPVEIKITPAPAPEVEEKRTVERTEESSSTETTVEPADSDD